MDQPQKISISCVIPAYNEAARIGAVLDVAAGHPALAEVVVADDGSSDGTAEAAARPGVRVLALPVNGGKSAAVCAGAALASGSHLMLLDADLAGITAADLTKLAQPVLSGAAEASISLRSNSPWLWRAIGLDYISGERVFPAELLRGAEMGRLPGFGLEVHLNREWLRRGLRLSIVEWEGVSNPSKAAKFGRGQGLRRDFGMMRDIFRVISPPEALGQIWRMRRNAL